ncbi:fungal specific transcription factor domain containing protein [Sporothrix brasiliensis 5110]|uniref:Fungal specific transcription factor domain containing protein n=1 Tax=Sporothrix brasiliensis 5110 TaxID=1398154 RepID=A0A0C2EWQ5_9PEZI|nr:fungal specific transcription factor domain containing protein [Sporothrix brasiliensis 5110]KIH91004.1 fungal specific transcription factor domain containing protein [Sporothrix brasiliensis 5110]
MKTWPTVVHEDAADEELELWRSLPPELRNPPVSEIFASRFFGQKTINERSLSEKIPQPLEMNTTSILFGTSNLAPVPHPEPRMVLHLWQTFIDSVNPVMRIVHVPTTHQQIVDASWDPANSPPATGALMFAVYALALTSMTISEYADMFTTTKTRQTSDEAVPPKRELLAKYRMGAMQCLVAAGILTTRRLDVLRAFTLFILAEPDSELCSTLAATAVHLGLSWACTERRARAHRKILGIDARMRLAVSLSHTNSISTMGSYKHRRIATGGNYFGSSMPLSDLDDLRLPLNVNDADLHPDMTCAPVEHAGPTEMLYVRVKYHTAPWMQTFAQKKFASSTSGDLGEVSTPAGHLFHTQTLPAMKNCAIDELEQLYTNICHQFADPRIPLHAVSSSMARMAVAQLRFQAYHPRTSAAQPPSQPPSALANGEQVSVIPAFSRYNADATFQHALSILEMCFECRQVAGVGNGFAAFQLLADLVMRVVMDAIVYVLCMLRVRTCGGNDDEEERAKIDSAWRMIELFYKEYAEDLAAATSAYEPHLLHMHHNASLTREPRNNDATAEENRKLASGATFVAAFTDLTLEAFDAHEKAWLGLGKGALITPEFIAELRAQKNTQREFLDPSSAAVTGLGEMLLQADDFAMDWEYLNNLLQI